MPHHWLILAIHTKMATAQAYPRTRLELQWQILLFRNQSTTYRYKLSSGGSRSSKRRGGDKVVPPLPVPLSPFPFLSSPYNGWGLGSAIAPPVGPSRARPPNAFWCSSQPKICKSVNVSPRVQDAYIQHFYDLPKFRLCPYCKLLQFRVSANLIKRIFFRMAHCILRPGTHCLKDSSTLSTCHRTGHHLAGC